MYLPRAGHRRVPPLCLAPSVCRTFLGLAPAAPAPTPEHGEAARVSPEPEHTLYREASAPLASVVGAWPWSGEWGRLAEGSMPKAGLHPGPGKPPTEARREARPHGGRSPLGYLYSS